MAKMILEHIANIEEGAIDNQTAISEETGIPLIYLHPVVAQTDARNQVEYESSVMDNVLLESKANLVGRQQGGTATGPGDESRATDRQQQADSELSKNDIYTSNDRQTRTTRGELEEQEALRMAEEQSCLEEAKRQANLMEKELLEEESEQEDIEEL
jgi:hypothetical protein